MKAPAIIGLSAATITLRDYEIFLIPFYGTK